MTLPGPSRTIIVEPVEQPQPTPVPAGPSEPGPVEPDPVGPEPAEHPAPGPIEPEPVEQPAPVPEKQPVEASIAVG